MQRFFLAEDAFQGEVVYFPDDVSHQISRVLRMQIGDEVVCIHPLGKEFRVSLTDVNPRISIGQVLSVFAAAGEPVLQLDIYIALTQREKFEWILQKCTEVGAASITPVITERSLIAKKQTAEKKMERWEKIIKEAAEQSHRGRVPVLKDTLPFEQVCSQVRADRRLIASTEGQTTTIEKALSGGGINQVALLIGPEGGFSPTEIQAGMASGWQSITLGKRILRMETAAVVASALILYQMGEMGN